MLLPLAALADVPVYELEGAPPLREPSPEGVAPPCFAIDASGALVFRVAGSGAITVRVVADKRGRHKVRISADGETSTADARDARPTSTRLALDEGLHDVTVEMPASSGGCVAIEGAERRPAARADATPATEPGAVAAPAAGVDATATPAVAPAAPEEPGRLVLGVAALAGVSDERETTATRFGGFAIGGGWRLTHDLALQAELRESFASQAYLDVGGAPGGSAALTESRTDATALVEWRIAHPLWERMSGRVFAGPRYLALRTDVVRPWMAGLLVGGGAFAELHDLLVADGGVGWAHRLLGSDDARATLGDFKTTVLWSGGLALRLAPHFRLRLGYRGETWVLEHTNRVSHGAEVGLIVRAF
ncbi:MAG: hypothetical protein AABZ30_12205 [Myxococcota bacterium]